jgi:hypothetical protein
MDKDLISGNWSGAYRYGRGYPAGVRGTRVLFSIRIDPFDGIFTGTCTDTYTDEYFRAPAIIEGEIEGNRIYFIKRYPSLLTIDEQGNTIVIPDEPSVNIQYEGRLYKSFFSGKYYLKGEWNIDGSYLDDTGNAIYYSSSGSWKVSRVNP